MAAKIDVFLSEAQIKARVSELAQAINHDYQGGELLVMGILNGSYVFLADLLREVKVALLMDFMKASSYEGTESTGKVKISLDTKLDLKGKDVLLVEDIVDTGHTMKALLSELEKRAPKSLKLASLLYKPARNIHPVKIDYLGFEIEDKFVIGYGLDFDGRYRELPYIGVYGGEE